MRTGGGQEPPCRTTVNLDVSIAPAERAAAVQQAARGGGRQAAHGRLEDAAVAAAQLQQAAQRRLPHLCIALPLLPLQHAEYKAYITPEAC